MLSLLRGSCFLEVVEDLKYDEHRGDSNDKVKDKAKDIKDFVQFQLIYLRCHFKDTDIVTEAKGMLIN